MRTFFLQAGIMAWPIVVIAVINLILVIRGAAAIARSAPVRGAGTPAAVHAVLFWGAVAAILGFLGQHLGLYNAFSAISRAREISPNIVAMGLAESLTTTIFGMTVLVLSAIAWFVLRTWHRRQVAA